MGWYSLPDPENAPFDIFGNPPDGQLPMYLSDAAASFLLDAADRFGTESFTFRDHSLDRETWDSIRPELSRNHLVAEDGYFAHYVTEIGLDYARLLNPAGIVRAY